MKKDIVNTKDLVSVTTENNMGNAKSVILKSRLRKLSSDNLAKLEENEDVDFNRSEIEEWYREFQLHLDKGITKLTVDVFKKIYNRVFDGDASSFAHHLFRSFDTNGDGYVDFEEFIVGLSVSGSTNTDKKLRWAFRMYDIDGNGLICKDEMTCILKDIYKMTNAMVNGTLGGPERITDAFFHEFDLDRDGFISFSEFKNGAQSDPLIIHLLECDPDP